MGVFAVMVLAALAFVVTGQRDAATNNEVDVKGISIERGAPAPLSATVPDAAWAHSIVRIETRRCSGDNSVASGVLVDGVVLTNRHVIDGAAKVTVETLRGERFDAVALRMSSSIDLASVIVPELDGGLKLAVGDDASAGDRYTMVGFPEGGEMEASTVTVNGRATGVGYPDSPHPLQLTSEVVPGQSGSPLIDADNRVAGVLYSRAFDGGAGLAHDAAEVARQWPSMTSAAFASCD